MKGMFPQVTYYLRHTSPSDIMIPSVVIAELIYGAHLSSDYSSNITAINRFISPFNTADFDNAAATSYGAIRSTLKKTGPPTDPNDTPIAATAMSRGATLDTHNIDEFSHIDGLHLSDWTE